MPTHHLYGAVNALIINEKGEFLLGKRKNTGFRDGWRGLVGGHIEQYEAASEAIIREVKEEAGIDVEATHCNVHHILHQHTKGNKREYFQVCFLIDTRTGKLENKEPAYCEEIKRRPLADFPENIVHAAKVFIDAYEHKGSFFTEIERFDE